MKSSSQQRTLAIGILIILIGFVVLLHQMNMIPAWLDNILISWQMLLIVIGAYNLISVQSRIFGYILISVGGFFLLPEIFILPNNFQRNFWPLILIIVGLFILFKHGLRPNKIPDFNVSESDHVVIDEFNLFSGSDKRLTIKGFRGGRITSIFGGSELDFTDCELSSDTNVLDVFYLFGGSAIRVPSDWNVVNKVTAILGGFSDKRKIQATNTNVPEKTLIIQGFVMFGGGEIKS
ncbi:MAG: cell wall-active antibiotics response protein [Bacteroidales bacterium]|nr:cell wall-active antibiotics response protein [Bacteroidales bacterium]MCF8403117.1 cell wall-active antibiotics response protein [Bacteroidales bacterium]